MKCAPAIRSDAKTLAQISQQIQHDDYKEIYDYINLKMMVVTSLFLKLASLKNTS